MKKITLFMAVILVMIACTFCAGCTDINGGTTAIDPVAQQEFDEWMNILETSSHYYGVFTGDVKGISFVRPNEDWLNVNFNTPMSFFKRTIVNLESGETKSIKNGIKLDAEEGSDVFIIKDSSLTQSTVTALSKHTINFPDFLVLYLSTEDYEEFLEDFNDWFSQYE